MRWFNIPKIQQLIIQICGKSYNRWKTYWVKDGKLILQKYPSYKFRKEREGKRTRWKKNEI